MLSKRIIACLDVRDGQVVKGVNFEGLRTAGDPAELARRYNAEGVDELVILDLQGGEYFALDWIGSRMWESLVAGKTPGEVAADLAADCAAPAPPQLVQAMAEFNAGDFFEQHETLELLWRATPGEIRHLYEGILQVGVGLYHLRRGNLYGARRLLARGIAGLQPFRPACLGVDVEGFVAQAARCLGAVEALSPEEGGAFDWSLAPRVNYRSEPSG